MITIERINNGYYITDVDNKLKIDDKYCVEDMEDDELLNIRRVLYQVAEMLGVTEDKHSSNNLNITFDRKGRKL